MGLKAPRVIQRAFKELFLGERLCSAHVEVALGGVEHLAAISPSLNEVKVSARKG